MAKNLIEKITEKQINPNIPEFRVGDTVCVDCKIIEEKGGKSKERIQKFEGIVISRKGTGATETFTVRKVSSGVGVERTFPVNSPVIDKITVLRKGKVRRSKLFYLRGRSGKAARIKEVR